MSHRQRAHAEKVVQSFQKKLSESQLASIGDNHFDELTLLIESAITSAVFEELEAAADQLDKVAHKFRNHAERYD